MTLSRNLSTLGQAVSASGNIPSANVSGLATVATTGSASDITTGTLPSSVYTGPSAPVVTIYSTPGPTTWTKPGTVKAIRVTVLSGGGGGACTNQGGSIVSGGGAGGSGAYGYFPAPSIPGPITVTVGSGGAPISIPWPSNTSTPGNAGGTSSFGSLISVTGGAGGTLSPGGTLKVSDTAQVGSVTPSLAPNVVAFYGTPGVPIVNYQPNTPATLPGQIPFAHGTGGNAALGFGYGGIFTGNFSNPTQNAGPGTGRGAGGCGMGLSPGGITATSGAGTAGLVIVEEFY